jgi:TfoX/Sxy family transcriptional regulator of competence genes
MAFDERLADRMREILGPQPDLSEKRMFGGLAFLVAGKMSVGVIGEDLIVRLSPEEAESALAEEGVRPFDFTGRPMKGWVFVGPEVTEDDSNLAEWVEAGVAYASSLPAKQRR